ncbi:hypothetical protein [Desulfotalea psychrophila]|uniref:Uncharacterized protein n=1 Tax=Desulfotalea psychrophila (strain LSv54 / DSM 12343) TaxID=177439 RepID=Q6APL2_DESPS|nr:hypothetical protein [Desulfotalea psychrophila]CAG35712.1 unknown protein [Desulfotalea psychrophila LSv54]
MQLRHRLSLLAIMVMAFSPSWAQANAGVPMLVLVMPAFAVALIPVILIESLYLVRRLALRPKLVAKTVTISNLVSTLVGIPLTWVLLTLGQMVTGGGSAHGVDTVLGKVLAVTWQAPWLIPYERELNWMIPAAGIVLLVPFFFVSWWSEYLVSRRFLGKVPAQQLKLEIRNANIITYSLLACWPIAVLLFAR